MPWLSPYERRQRNARLRRRAILLCLGYLLCALIDRQVFLALEGRERGQNDWGRLFRHWEHVQSDGRGYPEIPEEGARIERTGVRALGRSLGILATCIKEAPEIASRRRHKMNT